MPKNWNFFLNRYNWLYQSFLQINDNIFQIYSTNKNNEYNFFILLAKWPHKKSSSRCKFKALASLVFLCEHIHRILNVLFKSLLN